MNKLKFYNGKAMACLIILCLFLVQACRKDREPILQPVKANVITDQAIDKWFNQNPIAQFLPLDWKKARQATINGNHIVRVPTTNKDFVKLIQKANLSLKNSSIASNGLSPGIKNKVAVGHDPDPDPVDNNSGNNPNYFANHPPEVYFIQPAGESKMYTFIFNFIPDNPNSGFGQNGIWNGKLYEWSLKSDTVLVQTFANNILTDRYVQKYYLTNPDGSIESTRPEKLQSLSPLKDKMIGGIFGWLLDKIADGFGAVGYIFGLAELVPSTNPNVGHHNHYRFITHNGSSGDSSWNDIEGSGDVYTSAGYPMVSSYLTDLTNTGTPLVEVTYSSYNYSGAFQNGNGPNVGVPNASGIYILEYLTLSPAAQEYILKFEAIPVADAIKKYLDQNGYTVENLKFGSWAVEYLKQNSSKSFENILAFKQSSLAFNNKAFRSVEEELGVEEALNANDLNFVSKLIFDELTISDYYNNESTVNSTHVLNLNDDEPPFWTKVKSLFKLYMHIEQPRDQQDLQRLDRMNVTYTTVSGDIKRIHDYNSAALNFIPGYAVLDNIVAEQNYTAAAVNLSIDLFGGSLFKGITGPIFRVAEKYSFTTAELALKFPNIASKLRLFAIKGFNVIKRSNSNKIIIIGEDMANRVGPSKDLFNRLFQNVETFVGSSLAEQQLQGLKNLYGRNLTTEELKSTFMYIENQNWIKEKLAQGYNVIDIGPKIPSTIKSPFYGMERSFIYVK